MNIELQKAIKSIIYKIINEDFDFQKIKSKRIENEYQISKSIIRKKLEKIKVDKLFIDLYGDKGPTGLSNQVHIEGFGNVVCRGHSLDHLINYDIRAKLPLRTVSLVRSSDLEDIGIKYKFKPINYASPWYIDHHQKYENDNVYMPDYLIDLLECLGVDTEKYNCKLKCHISPDGGICIIEKSVICECWWGPERRQVKLLIPSMMFFTGNVLYGIDKKNVKQIEDDKKWLKKTDTFFHRAPIGLSFICRQYMYKLHKQLNGDPIWFFNWDNGTTRSEPNVLMTLTNLYADPQKNYKMYDKEIGDITDSLSLIGMLGPAYDYYTFPNMFKIGSDTMYDSEHQRLHIHITNGQYNIIATSDYSEIEELCGKEIADECPELYVKELHKDGSRKILYKFKIYLILSPVTLDLYYNYMSNKVKAKDLYFTPIKRDFSLLK